LSLRGNEVAEAISFVIGHFRDYFVVWFLTRIDGIASPAFGGLAMTEGVSRAQWLFVWIIRAKSPLFLLYKSGYKIVVAQFIGHCPINRTTTFIFPYSALTAG